MSPLGEALPADSASKKFYAPLADNAGANEFAPVAGENYRTQNGETVCDIVTSVTTVSGAGVTIGATSDAKVDTDAVGTISSKMRGLVSRMVELLARLPASLGQKPSATSLAVVSANQQFTNPITRIPGDNLSHSLGYSAAGATLNPTDDTMLSAAQTGHNGGIYDHINVGAVGAGSARRAIIRFAIGAYALNTLATVTLRLKSNAAALIAGTLQAYAIKPANAGWVEGVQNWAAAATTDPSWAKKSQTPDVAWAGSAGLGTGGTDYDSTSLGTLTWDLNPNTWYQMTMSAALLQAVCAANNGFVLIADDEATANKYCDLRSNDDGTPANRPELVITIPAAQKAPKRVFLVADGIGATWANGAAATADNAPIPTTGIEVPYCTNDVAALSVYVPVGVNVWFAGIGYE